MPVRRSQVRRAEHTITGEAEAAYRASDHAALHRALGLKPWEVSPLDAEGDAPWSPGSAGAKTWDKVVRLRAELEAAVQSR